jgi:hypothetical protein
MKWVDPEGAFKFARQLVPLNKKMMQSERDDTCSLVRFMQDAYVGCVEAWRGTSESFRNIQIWTDPDATWSARGRVYQAGRLFHATLVEKNKGCMSVRLIEAGTLDELLRRVIRRIVVLSGGPLRSTTGMHPRVKKDKGVSFTRPTNIGRLH